MTTPDTELYHPEHIEDELGDGMRIYTTPDDVYEVRERAAASTRIYPAASGRWAVKTRFDVVDVEDGYDVFRDVLTALDAEEDVPTPKAFTDALQGDGTATARAAGGEVRYAEETDLDAMVDIDIDRNTKVKGALAGIAAESGTGGLIGAVLGGAAGIPGGPPAMAGGAMMGGGVGGALGGLVAGLEVPMAERTWEDRDLPVERMIYRMHQRRKRKLLDGRVDAFEQHLAAVNRMRSYEQRLEEAESLDMEVRELYDSYVAEERDTLHDVLFDVHFNAFERRDGVTVSVPADTYAEAVETAADLLEAPVHNVERPSIYTSQAAFQELFDHYRYTEDGEERLLNDARLLVANVFERDDVDPAIVAWLEERYPDAVQEEGRERVLEADER